MLLERTIYQLDIGPVSPKRALELGQLGYLQWLGGVRGDEGYVHAAMAAYAKAQPYSRNSPAVAVFCDLLIASTRKPLVPLSLSLVPRQRRGGAQSRRAEL